MYTVKRAARLVGVGESTLRAWERRYGLGPTDRSTAGYRLYDEEAIRRLTLMHGLVQEGYSAREAAEEVRRRAAERHAEATGDGLDDHHSLVEAARSFDTARLARLLELRFSEAPFETVADEWLFPSLARLGEAWEGGEVSVAGEHVVAAAVGRQLSITYNALRAPARLPRVVIGLPPGARHDLGLLAFATAARRAGLATTYLGADVPAEDWARAVTVDCRAAVLAAPRLADVEPLAEAVEAIEERRPGLLVAVGGAEQDHAPGACLRLGHEIGRAAQLLAGRLTDATDHLTGGVA